jgi:hypothetical protein
MSSDDPVRLRGQNLKLYEAMCGQKGKDVSIARMYKAAVGNPTHKSNRDMQMRLGSVIQRVNKKLKKTEIVAGTAKQTYRLQDKPKETSDA